MHVMAKEMYFSYEASLISKFELSELLVLADIKKLEYSRVHCQFQIRIWEEIIENLLFQYKLVLDYATSCLH